jgi:GNAT superfamily N-acetyltransferase
VTLEVGRCDPEAVAALLRGLPEWFGIEEATAAYVEAARTMPTVDATRHRRGIGTALLERAEAELGADHVRYLQVKTLGPSFPDEEYERTRRFYQARGFVALEEIFGFWAEDNPMLIMVKAL